MDAYWHVFVEAGMSLLRQALISAESLTAALASGPRVIYEVASSSLLFERAHVPGARRLPAEPALKDAGGMTLISPQQFDALAADMGLREGAAPVFYDGGGGVASARATWVFRYYGVPAQILDGGWGAWVRGGGRVEMGAPGAALAAHAAAPVRAQPVAALRADLAEVCGAPAARAQLVDARSYREYIGEELRGNAYPGRPLGAVHVPHTSVLTHTGSLAPPSELQRLFRAAGLHDLDACTIVYCQAGVRASLVAIALDAAGFRNVKVYDESCAEYNNREGLGREMGSARV